MDRATIDRFKSGYGLEVIVKMGDIMDAEADGIVTGENEHLQGTGQVTQTLMRKLPQFKEKRDELKKKELKAWTVRKTPVSDYSKLKFVFHAFLRTNKKEKNWVEKMTQLYGKILKKAEKRKTIILAIPLLGSGSGKKSPNDSAQALVTAIAAYKPSSLRQLLLVTKDKGVADKIVTQCMYEFSKSSQSDSSKKSFLWSKMKSLSLPRASGTSPSTTVSPGVDAITRTNLRGVDASIGAHSNTGVDVRPKKAAVLNRAISEPAGNPVLTFEDVARRRITSLSVFKEDADDIIRVRVLDDSETYTDVAESFLRCFQTQPTIKQIDRIEIKVLECQYLAKKNQFLGRQKPIEQVLWHRSSEESRKYICVNGFDRSYSGKDGPAGYGVYFTTSPDSPIEDTYMYSAIEDVKYVFRARVLTGAYTLGMPGSRVPPKQMDGMLHDSTVDDVNNPRLYVIYNDTQAYPEYLITYI